MADSEKSSTIVVLDDHFRWAELYVDWLQAIPEAKNKRVRAFESARAATDYVRSDPSSVAGYILDLYLSESLREDRWEGLDFFNSVVLATTPRARTLFVSALFNAETIRQVFVGGGGSVDVLDKSDLSIEEFETSVRWLLAPDEAAETCSPDSGIRVAQLVEVHALPWADIQRYISRNPEFLDELSSQRFEELVAEIYRDHGWEVDLTAKTRDGGFDIVAVRRSFPSSLKVLVEAKRHRPDQPISVGIVRSVFALRELHAVSQVVLATTSYVSRDARAEFSRVVPWVLDFFERDQILEWCRSSGVVKFSLGQ